MNISDLPVGAHPKALSFPHFPTQFQAVIWRNLGMVEPSLLAKILHSDEATVLRLAADMGLRVPPRVDPLWLKRGYVSIIHANWHLLPYGQLLELLGWTPERMAKALQEEDFLWVKLGGLKPETEPAYCRPLTDEEKNLLYGLKQPLQNIFPQTTFPQVGLRSNSKRTGTISIPHAASCIPSRTGNHLSNFHISIPTARFTATSCLMKP